MRINDLLPTLPDSLVQQVLSRSYMWRINPPVRATLDNLAPEMTMV